METRRLITILTGIAVAIVVAIGAIIVVSSLSGGGGDGGQAARDRENGAQGEEDGGGEDEGPQLPERIEGELRLFGPEPITLDPACASDAGSAEYIVEIFSGLVSFDRDLNLIPDIAERWDVSPDGTVYTFHLRRNVLFHDSSRRVTAADFKFSMERALNPATQSTVGEVYLSDIVGADEFIDGRADEVSGIRVIDDNTLEITIKQPSAVFLDKLTYPTAYVVDQREVGDATCFEGADWTLSPNGTGPFKLAEWDLGQSIVLEANPNYYLEPKPSLARVTYLLSGGSALTMYENDEIDVTGVGINDIERIRDPNEPLNREFTESESLDTYYIGFNTTREPFNDVNVRRALAMAVDKELLAREILADLVVPAKGILPPGMPGYNEDLEGLPYDPERARELLDEAGGPEILEDVTLITSGRGGSPGPILDALVAMWEQNLGVTITVEQQDFGFFLRTIDQRDFDMFSLGWIADYPDPQNFLEIKLHSGSPDNETGYSNPEVDRLLDEAETETDEARRMELYQQAEEIIVDEAPWIPLYHGKSGVLVKPYVKGYVVPAFVIPNLRYVSIER
jgi:oligopeptide transport system substrate-binding protein